MRRKSPDSDRKIITRILCKDNKGDAPVHHFTNTHQGEQQKRRCIEARKLLGQNTNEKHN
jgi:hypothetical protein